MIKTVVTDVDGVLNTGQFLYDATGKCYKVFGPHDNDGIKMLRGQGVDVIAVTADWRGYKITAARCVDLNIRLMNLNEAERGNILAREFPWDTTLFLGDGYYDVESLAYFKYSAAPANAVRAARNAAKLRLRSRGGEGVMLELALQLLNPTWLRKLGGWCV